MIMEVPYYIKVDDEKEYRSSANNIIKVNNNEEIIPCDILIINSVFNYMLYTMLTEWKETDKE